METALVVNTERGHFYSLTLDCLVVLDALTSPSSKRAYSRALRGFLDWH